MTKFKTLKDLKKKWNEISFTGGGYKMIPVYIPEVIEYEKVRQEAIRWAKDVSEDKWDDGWESFCEFFNIIEEDLE